MSETPDHIRLMRSFAAKDRKIIEDEIASKRKRDREAKKKYDKKHRPAQPSKRTRTPFTT